MRPFGGVLLGVLKRHLWLWISHKLNLVIEKKCIKLCSHAYLDQMFILWGHMRLVLTVFKFWCHFLHLVISLKQKNKTNKKQISRCAQVCIPKQLRMSKLFPSHTDAPQKALCWARKACLPPGTAQRDSGVTRRPKTRKKSLLGE